MTFDEMGLPRDKGATDFQDSARLAGLAVIFCPEYKDIPLKAYSTFLGVYRRHPKEFKYKFSRDQAVCLFAGYYFNDQSWIVDPEYTPENGDWIMPSVRGHFKRCARRSTNWLEDLWLWFDVLWSCYVQPRVEPNQLICMLMVADKKYLKFWVKHNSSWKKAIRGYWSNRYGSWRGEDELAEYMIQKLKKF